MSLLRRITNLFHRSKLDQEIEAELRSHIEMRTTDNIAAGMSPEEARRDALLRFGNRAVLKERVTATDAQVFLDSLWQDLCYGLRMLRRNPGFATMAILALGLGIGSATVIFSTIYGVVFDTFPYKNFGDVAIFEVNDSTQAAGRGYMAMSLADFADYRTENQVFEDMVCGWGGLGLTDVAYRSESESVDYSVYYVSANLFEFMGVTPLLGRWSTPEDTKPGATPVFVMSYKLWREQFNRNPAIIGRAFPLNGVSRTLVGVMPPRFRWGDSDIWIPFSIQRNQLSTNAIPADANVWPIGRTSSRNSFT